MTHIVDSAIALHSSDCNLWFVRPEIPDHELSFGSHILPVCKYADPHLCASIRIPSYVIFLA